MPVTTDRTSEILWLPFFLLNTFCMDLPLVAMEKILQHVTSDDLLYVMNVARDKMTVTTVDQ